MSSCTSRNDSYWNKQANRANNQEAMSLNYSSDGLAAWQRIAKRPNAFLDYFQLGLPFSWQVVAIFRRIPLGDLRHYSILLSLTMPLYMAAQKTRASRSIVLPVFSIWSSVCLWKIATPLYRLVSGMKIVLSSTSITHPSAWECMAKRIEQGLLYRKRQYDVYLPPKNCQQHNKPSILFFPGAFVPHEAYAQPVSRLADAGYTVVVVSAQVLKLVDHHLPRFRAAHLRSIMNAVGTPGGEWVLAGHSMGSFLCTKVATQLPNVHSVVMWGTAPFLQYLGDLSDSSIRVLVVQASNDMIIDSFATQELMDTFYALLPSQRTVYEIEGGTHSGFANYRPHWKPEVDGIPVDQQHAEAVDISIRFLEGAQ